MSELITDVPDKEMLGLNIVEFAGDDAELIESGKHALPASGRADCAGEGGVIGWQLCNDLSGIERIYAMRKRRWGCSATRKGRRSRFRLRKIPACHRNIWRIISWSFARCSTAMV